jgi:hypothetical protein
MNGRIQELILKATETVDVYNPDTGITHHREFFDKEKFAVLIIRECIELNRQELSFSAFARILDTYDEHFVIE